MVGPPSHTGAFTTVLITGSHDDIKVCRFDIPQDFVSPRASGHHCLGEALSMSMVAHTAAA
jgi:hypothetical protein